MIQVKSMLKHLMTLVVLMVIHVAGYGQCPPSAPVITAATDVTCFDFTANWTAISGATSYWLDVSATDDFGSLLAGYDNLEVAGTSQPVYDLSPGLYYYRVRAEKPCGLSNSSAMATIYLGPEGGTSYSVESGNGLHQSCGTSYGATEVVGHNGWVVRWEGSYDNIYWETIEETSSETLYTDCCITADTLYVRAVIESDCGEAASTVTKYVRRTASFEYPSPYCNWNASNNPAIHVPNPTPGFVDNGVAGTFSGSAGLVFANSATGEVNLQATPPGTYTITNTLGGGCNLSATASLQIRPGLPFTISEQSFSTIVPMAYYRVIEVATNPALMDTTQYRITWTYLTAAGFVRPVTDIEIPWESVAQTGFASFVVPDPVTGVRTADALCVDILNKQTGCITRRCVGKDPSTLPAPGSNFREEQLEVVTGVEGGADEQLKLYPNPVSGTLHVVLPKPGAVEVELQSLNGLKVKGMTSAESTFSMDVSGLSNGLYVIYIRQGNKLVRKKVQVMN